MWHAIAKRFFSLFRSIVDNFIPFYFLQAATAKQYERDEEDDAERARLLRVLKRAGRHEGSLEHGIAEHRRQAEADKSDDYNDDDDSTSERTRRELAEMKRLKQKPKRDTLPAQLERIRLRASKRYHVVIRKQFILIYCIFCSSS